MNTNLSLLFYVRKQKNYDGGEAPIYLRLTVNGKRIEIATGRQCDPKRWNSKAGRLSGSKEDVRSINAYLSTLQDKVFGAYSELVRCGDLITAESVKDKFNGRTENPKLLLEVIKEHNQRMEALVGTEYAWGTLNRYRVLESHTNAFLKAKFGVSDLDIKKVDFAFVSDYEFYLRSVRKMSNNSVVRHMKMLRKIINICLNNNWIQVDPYSNFKGKYKKVDKAILTQTEINLIADKKFVSERLTQVRDSFLFCCYTGLSYSDVHNLRPSDIIEGFDGQQWIFIRRVKTDQECNIPLLPEAKAIVDKYLESPARVLKGNLLPVARNQKMNDFLKQIAVLCGINKSLTCHVARYTFATTITLQNGVPIETVSSISNAGTYEHSYNTDICKNSKCESEQRYAHTERKACKRKCLI